MEGRASGGHLEAAGYAAFQGEKVSHAAEGGLLGISRIRGSSPSLPGGEHGLSPGLGPCLEARQVARLEEVHRGAEPVGLRPPRGLLAPGVNQEQAPREAEGGPGELQGGVGLPVALLEGVGHLLGQDALAEGVKTAKRAAAPALERRGGSVLHRGRHTLKGVVAQSSRTQARRSSSEPKGSSLAWRAEGTTPVMPL